MRFFQSPAAVAAVAVLTMPAAAQRLTWLGTLGGESGARGVSDNGVVVGRAQNASGQWRAVRWTETSPGVWTIQDLGTLGSSESAAWGVSADGSVVVGWAQNAIGQQRAFRWTAQGGMEDLNQTYAHLLTSGSVLFEVRAISPDGRYIVGYGYNEAIGRYEAFLLDTQGATAVEEPAGHPRAIELYPNFPNPFSPETQITFRLPRTMQVRVVITNMLGQEVKVLAQGMLPAGTHQVTWDGTDESALPGPPGVYLYRLEADGNICARKMVLLQ